MATQPTEYERFPNAPIVEAILSVGVQPRSPVDVSSVAAFQEAVADQYPHQGEGLRFSSTLQVDPGEQSVKQSLEQRRIGYDFRAPDDSAVVRVVNHGFSYHYLASYPGWSEFSEHARAAWDAYVDVFSPERVEKIGLRYLDRIELPLPFEDLKEYLRTYPEVAPAIDTGFAGYLLRLALPRPDIPAVGWITQSIEPVREDSGFVPLVFDVDVVREGSFPLDDDLFWGTLERLREYKNELFFESITAKARDLFR